MTRALMAGVLALILAAPDGHAADARPPAGMATASAAALAARGATTGAPMPTPAAAADGHVVGEAEIATLIQRSATRGGQRNLQIELAAGRYDWSLPAGVSRRIEVEDLFIDPRQGRFSARLIAGDPQAKTARLDVAGRATESVSVPMLVRDAKPGDTIQDQDLTWSETDASRVGRDVILDARDLVGKEPKRTLKAGRAIRASELTEATLVAKGEPVAMTVSTRGMQLSAVGHALEAGARGDVIRVRNVHSSRIVEGTVTGPGTVQMTLGTFPLRTEKRSR